MHHVHSIPVLAAMLVPSLAPARAQLAIDNFTDGDVVQQAAVLLRGRCTSASEVVLVHGDGREVYRAPVAGGRFLAVVDVPPGRNTFTLRAGDEQATLSLEHRPAMSPYRLRVVYVVAADGSTDFPAQRAAEQQNYELRLDTVAKLLQAFTAESLRDAGFGRNTFQLETDAAGRVVVHTLEHASSRDELQQLEGNALWSAMAAFVGRKLGRRQDKLLVVTGFSGYDPATRKAKAHTALGGGSVGVFSNLCMHSWPASLADVPRAFTDATSVDTSKVSADVGLPDLYHLASTTIGALLHEMGHTFDLPHTGDPRCIMSRGFDFLHRAFVPGEPSAGGLQPHAPDTAAYWSPAFAMRLAHSPWFLPDRAPAPLAAAPRYEVAEGGARVTAEAAAGIAAWSVHCGGAEPTKAVAHRVDDPMTELTVDFDDLRRRHELSGPLTILLYDRAHRPLRIEENRVSSRFGYLRRWQIGKPRPWDREPPELPGPQQLERWRQDLAEVEARDVTPGDASPFLSVDLLEQLRRGQDQHVLLRTTVLRPAAGPATLLLGGDDGARIWINGKLVFDRVELAVFPTDGIRVPVEFVAGENEVLVHSFQGGGGWGISLRFEDAAAGSPRRAGG